MYADDVVIFVIPARNDITNLAFILRNFGEVTGLTTNLLKTSVVPISCEAVSLDDTLSGFPVQCTNFPIKYLGLPLTVQRLRKVDFQPFLDKAASKLAGWQGRHLTQAGRICLTKLVLSSLPIYLLSVLKAPKEILDDLDKVRKKFIWAGDNTLTG